MVKPSVQFISELFWWQIRPIKVWSMRTIASFDSHVNDLSIQFKSEENCLWINKTNKSEINSNSNDDQSHSIKQFTIRPNTPIIIMPMGLGLQKSNDWKLMWENKKQNNSSIDLIVLNLTINWDLRLNSKELTYLSSSYFFWPLVILVISIFTITSRNLFTWLPLLIQLTKLSQLNTSLWFHWKHLFSKCQISIVLSRDLSRDFFCSCWASSLINVVKLLALR